MIQLLEQKEYNRESIKQNLSAALNELGGLKNVLKGKSKVLLKPNFVVPEAKEGGSTTHPEFYMSVAELLLDNGFKVGIGESPAFGSCKKALKFHGVLDECRQKNIEVVEFNQTESFSGPSESSWQKLTIAAELQDWDGIINLPKLKVHQQFMFTGASKNLYGCVTGKRKFVRHNLCKNDPTSFAKMIIANAEKAACTLHIGDGIEAMHVKGPRGGEIYPLKKIIISDNFLHHDWLFAHLIGLDPEITPLFKACDKPLLESIKKDCYDVMQSPCFSVAENFIQSYRTDISFSPWHLMRTGWRSMKFKLKRAQ